VSSLTTLAVIIPTHNRLELLIEALASVARQTRPPDEVIVIDDGSTDGTAEHVRESFPGVRLIEQRNAEVSVARNAGLAVATSEWVSFWTTTICGFPKS
jgi:glycosyltransferase involved in cell wall biosynthesis